MDSCYTSAINGTLLRCAWIEVEQHFSITTPPYLLTFNIVSFV